LTKKEANDNYDICLNALTDVKNEITLRVQNEKHEDKISVLEHLLELIRKVM
jgi:hypothetical protein